MKSITATLVAITAMGLCTTPLARAADDSAIESKIKQMEDSWAASQMQKDHGASAVEAMLASDYAGAGSKGEIRDKSSQIKHIKDDTDTYTSSKNDSMKVRVLPVPMSRQSAGPPRKRAKTRKGKNSAVPSRGSILGCNGTGNGNASPAAAHPVGEKK